MPNPISVFRGLLTQQTATNITSTLPTFAGITTATANTNGSLVANWAAATTTKTPVEYVIYISIGSVNAVTLFAANNIHSIVPSTRTSAMIFTLANQSTFISNGQIYTLGVRAKDAFGYSDLNTAIQTVTATGSSNLSTVIQNAANLIVANTY